MKRFTLVLALGLVLCAWAQAADFFDGHKLFDYWTSYKKWSNGSPGVEPTDLGIFEGFVMGIAAAQDKASFQLPDNVGPGQLYMVVGKFLDEHGEWLGGSASSLVATALKLAYPPGKK